jgi:hypothetical protein
MSTETLTIEMALPEERFDERRNASEYYSNSATWFMKNGALSFGLMKAK